MYEYTLLTPEIEQCIGKTIESAKIEDNSLRLDFTDNSFLHIRIQKMVPEQSDRMIITDSIRQFIGTKLIEVYIRDYGIEVSQSGGLYTSRVYMDVYTELGNLTVECSINRQSYDGQFVFNTLELE